jgi:phosphotransferase system  glucose/maltose/N-acetylglucosamine-specific IIC component
MIENVLSAGFAGLVLPSAVDNQEHSSGFLGFIVMFALAIAVYFLVRNLTGRLRRMNYAHEHEVAAAAADTIQPRGGRGVARSTVADAPKDGVSSTNSPTSTSDD